MATQKKVKLDAKALEDAQNTWTNFMAVSKVSLYAACAILVLLWLFFIAL